MNDTLTKRMISRIDAYTAVLGVQNPMRYVKSAIWLTLGKAASMIVSLLATFYVVRALGPQNFGELSYAQSVIGILAILGTIAGTFYRDLVREPENEYHILGTAWTASILSSVVVSVLALGYVLFTPHDALSVWIMGILCVVQFLSPFSIIQNVFYAKTETRWLAISSFLISLTISVLKLTAILLGKGVLMLAVILVIEQVLNGIVYIGLYTTIHHKSILLWRFNAGYAKRLVADSFPMMIVAAGGMIAARVDQVFIRHYLDVATVGLYGVAVQLSELWQFFPGIILATVFPALVRARNHPLIYRKRFFSLMAVIVVYGVIVSLIVTIAAPLLIRVIYGAAFTGSIPLLQIYIWSLTGQVLGFAMTYFLITENLRVVQVVSALPPMLTNVLLNIILIPKYGASGAAMATAVSYTLIPITPFLFGSVRAALREH